MHAIPTCCFFKVAPEVPRLKCLECRQKGLPLLLIFRGALPYRHRIHNLVVHQRRSPLLCRRSILLRRSASLHRSRTAAPGSVRGLARLRNSGMPEGPLFYFPFSFFFLGLFSCVFFFVFFETPRLRSLKFQTFKNLVKFLRKSSRNLQTFEG